MCIIKEVRKGGCVLYPESTQQRLQERAGRCTHVRCRTCSVLCLQLWFLYRRAVGAGHEARPRWADFSLSGQIHRLGRSLTQMLGSHGKATARTGLARGKAASRPHLSCVALGTTRSLGLMITVDEGLFGETYESMSKEYS